MKPEIFFSFLYRPLRALGLPLALMALGALFASPAHADIWGYVDKDGIAHFSAVRLDDRYELFFRGSESFSAGGGVKSGKAVGNGANLATGVANAPPKLLEIGRAHV